MNKNEVPPLTAERMERMAQVAWETQRSLVVASGLSALNQEVPRPWVVALPEDKHKARETVCDLYRMGEVKETQGRRLEDLLVQGVVWAFREEAKKGN